MSISSGLFTLNEFYGREVLKLAPDAFVVINGALGARVVAPIEVSTNSKLDVRGGVTNINVNASLYPPGSSRATLEVIAPQYKGLHEDYYVTLPNGTRIPYFVPMMEVKIYAKGRFLNYADSRPKYYPIFWGLITDVSENYFGGVNTFSITCQDLLMWWKYQMITIKPSVYNILYGSGGLQHFSTIFENMTIWEVIFTLFDDTKFLQGENVWNFMFPSLSKNANIPPNFQGVRNIRETFGALAKNTVDYWNQRFGFVDLSNPISNDKAPLEMFGLVSQIKLEDLRKEVNDFSHLGRTSRPSARKWNLDLNYNLLGVIQPFGAFEKYGSAEEALTQSKLDIAKEVCDQAHFEFFLDTNGVFVFKPPFYNLDVNSPDTPEYIIEAKDINTLSTQIVSDNIVNYLEVTSPQLQEIASVDDIGYHIDWDLVGRFGIRYQSLALRYGHTAKLLRMLAVGEMSKINAKAFTGNVQIPMRPEMRLGYPVYIKHTDTYYYVTNINHTFSYGAASTTDLSLEARRERVFDDGSITNKPGTCLKAYVYRWRSTAVTSQPVINPNTGYPMRPEMSTANNNDEMSAAELANEQAKEDLRRQNGSLAGPKSAGFYQLTRASLLASVDNPNTQDAVENNELTMITDVTSPFTDLLGYKHIGSFPFGANLKLKRNGDMANMQNTGDKVNLQTEQVLGANPNGGATKLTHVVEGSTTVPTNLVPYGQVGATPIPEQAVPDSQQKMNDAYTAQQNAGNNPDPSSRPQAYKDAGNNAKLGSQNPSGSQSLDDRTRQENNMSPQTQK